jgi:hypothetical protein
VGLELIDVLVDRLLNCLLNRAENRLLKSIMLLLDLTHLLPHLRQLSLHSKDLLILHRLNLPKVLPLCRVFLIGGIHL